MDHIEVVNRQTAKVYLKPNARKSSPEGELGSESGSPGAQAPAQGGGYKYYFHIGSIDR